MPFLDGKAQIKSRFIKKCSGVLAQATGTEKWIAGKVTLTIMIGDLLQMIIGVVQIISVPFLVSVRF